MGLEDAEKEVQDGAYEDAVDDIEKEIDDVERDFETVKNSNATGDLKQKQEQAEEILGEIHDQISFLQKQLKRINKEDN